MDNAVESTFSPTTPQFNIREQISDSNIIESKNNDDIGSQDGSKSTQYVVFPSNEASKINLVSLNDNSNVPQQLRPKISYQQFSPQNGVVSGSLKTLSATVQQQQFQKTLSQMYNKHLSFLVLSNNNNNNKRFSTNDNLRLKI